MWVGQQLADGLDFWGFLGSLILGGIILGIYTGLLGYVGAKTGLSLDLLSQRAFGEKRFLSAVSHDQLYADRMV